MQRLGLGTVTGIEVDPATVALARERHPEVTIAQGDLQHAGDALGGPFQLIYSMTALYAAPDQAAVFRELGALAPPGAELRLLEYADPEDSFAAATGEDPLWRGWHPLSPRALPDLLASAGWKTLLVRDLHQEFVLWYERLCALIAARRDSVVREFGGEWQTLVAREYAGILDAVHEHVLGGVLVLAQRA